MKSSALADSPVIGTFLLLRLYVLHSFKMTVFPKCMVFPVFSHRVLCRTWLLLLALLVPRERSILAGFFCDTCPRTTGFSAKVFLCFNLFSFLFLLSVLNCSSLSGFSILFLSNLWLLSVSLKICIEHLTVCHVLFVRHSAQLADEWVSHVKIPCSCGAHGQGWEEVVRNGHLNSKHQKLVNYVVG